MIRRKDIAWLKDIEQAILSIEHHPRYSGGRAAYDEDDTALRSGHITLSSKQELNDKGKFYRR